MKHTPGPWIYSPDIDQVEAFQDSGNRSLQVKVGSFNPVPDYTLIAAAPDLLDALKRLVSYGDVFSYRHNETSPYRQAVAAIEKAEGR
jgi:hypothetical protein